MVLSQYSVLISVNRERKGEQLMSRFALICSLHLFFFVIFGKIHRPTHVVEWITIVLWLNTVVDAAAAGIISPYITQSLSLSSMLARWINSSGKRIWMMRHIKRHACKIKVTSVIFSSIRIFFLTFSIWTLVEMKQLNKKKTNKKQSSIPVITWRQLSGISRRTQCLAFEWAMLFVCNGKWRSCHHPVLDCCTPLLLLLLLSVVMWKFLFRTTHSGF